MLCINVCLRKHILKRIHLSVASFLKISHFCSIRSISKNPEKMARALRWTVPYVDCIAFCK